MKLTPEERQLVFDLFNTEIQKSGPLAKLDFLEGKINKNALEWHKKHQVWLKEVMNKLLAQ